MFREFEELKARAPTLARPPLRAEPEYSLGVAIPPFRSAWAPRRANYRAWLVDLDGTLYASGPVKVAMAAELALGHWRAAWVLRRFRAEHERLRREAPSSVLNPYGEQIARTARACRLREADVDALAHRWMFRRPRKWLRLFRRRWLIEEINRFKKEGGLIGIVSDYPVKEKLGALSITNLVDVTVASGDSLAPYRLKPSPDGYRTAAAHLGVLARECLVIGDRADADGQAAQRAGMAFVHVLTPQARGHDPSSHS